MKTYDLRCPVGPGRLHAKVLTHGECPEIVEDNLVELACTDCKKALRAQGKQVFRVLHQFNLAGELVRSIVQE